MTGAKAVLRGFIAYSASSSEVLAENTTVPITGLPIEPELDCLRTCTSPFGCTHSSMSISPDTWPHAISAGRKQTGSVPMVSPLEKSEFFDVLMDTKSRLSCVLR